MPTSPTTPSSGETTTTTNITRRTQHGDQPVSAAANSAAYAVRAAQPAGSRLRPSGSKNTGRDAKAKAARAKEARAAAAAVCAVRATARKQAAKSEKVKVANAKQKGNDSASSRGRRSKTHPNRIGGAALPPPKKFVAKPGFGVSRAKGGGVVAKTKDPAKPTSRAEEKAKSEAKKDRRSGQSVAPMRAKRT